MTFDELWRMKFFEEKGQTDSTSTTGTQTVNEQARDKLELTDEDRAFLLQVGIRA
jgi:hypothetical protein